MKVTATSTDGTTAEFSTFDKAKAWVKAHLADYMNPTDTIGWYWNTTGDFPEEAFVMNDVGEPTDDRVMLHLHA